MIKAVSIALSLSGAFGTFGLSYQLFYPPISTIGTWCIAVILVTTGLRWIIEAIETATS